MFNKKRTLASLLALGLVTSSVGVTSLADDNGKGQETVVTDNDNLNTREENSSYQFKENLEMEVQEGEERAEVEFSEDLDKPVWVGIYKNEGEQIEGEQIVGEGGLTEESTGYGVALINLTEEGKYMLKVKENGGSEDFLAEIPLEVVKKGNGDDSEQTPGEGGDDSSETPEGEDGDPSEKNPEEEKVEKEVVKEGETFDLETGYNKSVWVEVQQDEELVGSGGMTEADGIAKINLTEAGEYKVIVKDKEDGEVLKEITLTMTDKEDAEEEKVEKEVVKEGETFDLETGYNKSVWVEVQQDEELVGSGGMTEADGIAKINLTEAGEYKVIVKDKEDGEVLKEITLTMTDKEDAEEEKVEKEVVKEGETFDLETGYNKSVWVEVQQDEELVGSGGMTEADGIAKINLTEAGEYKVIVKDKEDGEVLKEITLTMTDTKKALKEKIEEGKNTSTNGKTYNSRKKLKDAIEKAENVLNDENSKLEDMKEAIKAIDDAINGLVNQPSTGGSSGGGSSSSDRDKNKDKDDDDDRRDDRRDRYYDDGGRRYSSSTDEVRYFKDLAGYAWAEPAIKNLSMRNIIKGKTEDKFDPSANIKRGEFAVIVARYLRLDTTNTVVLNNFDDVSRDKYYYTAVNLLANKGIIEGKGARRYDPEAPITRQEIAKIVASLDNKSVGDKTSINKFKDHGKIASWAKEPMAKLVNNNILTGYGDGTVRPQGNAKRAEVAVMIYRLGN